MEGASHVAEIRSNSVFSPETHSLLKNDFALPSVRVGTGIIYSKTSAQLGPALFDLVVQQGWRSSLSLSTCCRNPSLSVPVLTESSCSSPRTQSRAFLLSFLLSTLMPVSLLPQISSFFLETPLCFLEIKTETPLKQRTLSDFFAVLHLQHLAPAQT